MSDKNFTEQAWEWMIDNRGIHRDDVCKKCDGFGVRAYASTSTWRGGIGGAAITSGVCDGCWGSGSQSRPWVDLRKLSAHPELRSALSSIPTGKETK